MIAITAMVRQSKPRRSAGGAPNKAASAEEARADKQLFSAMQTTLMDEQRELAAYVHKTIDENPSWVPWLANLFRRGRMARFMAIASQADDQDDAAENIGQEH